MYKQNKGYIYVKKKPKLFIPLILFKIHFEDVQERWYYKSAHQSKMIKDP